jgi:hypothetical protein
LLRSNVERPFPLFERIRQALSAAMGVDKIPHKFFQSDSSKEADMFGKIRKRDGRVVEFDSSKITRAIVRAGKATGQFGQREAEKLTRKVLSLAHESGLGPLPPMEEIQDIVEISTFPPH